MCGIVGFAGTLTPEAINWIDLLCEEASLRGTHATGWAHRSTFLGLHVEHAPRPYATERERMLDQLREIADSEFVTFAFHARYSTSDLRYNQPLLEKNRALVLNGVIDQRPREQWANPFGWEWQTRNDAEIALKYSLHGALDAIPGSYAAIELMSPGLRAWRNGLRPLHHVCADEGHYFASTTHRLNELGYRVNAIAPGEIVRVDAKDGLTLSSFKPRNAKDLQV